MGTYTAKTRNVGRRPRSKRLRELGGSVTINNGAMPDLSGYELLSNKVTAVDSESTDVQYPSAKLLYDLYAALGALITALDEGKQDAIADLEAIRSGAALGATALQAITAAAGSDIGTVGTPSVTVSTQGSSTTLTFHQLKGAKGDKGDKGDTGETGPQGPAGANGTNGTTPTIAVAAGSNIGSVGTPSVTKSTSGTTTTFTFNYLKGAKGDKGDKGDTGATGPTGPQGPQGPAGANGTNGTTPTIAVAAGSNIGSVGTPSVTKSTSGTTTTFTFNYLKGAKGDKGDTGATGPTGPQGPQGPAGSNATVTVDSALSSTSTNPVQNKVVKAALDGKAASSHTHSTIVGSYTYNGGKQNPNYFGVNKVGALMMNTTVNGNSHYKDWLFMDCYSGNDVGGGVAIGVNRQALGAYIMRSAAARTAWAESAELLGTHNWSIYCAAKSHTHSYLPLSGGTISDQAITAAKSVVAIAAKCTAPTANIAVYGLKVELTCTGTPPTNTTAAAIYGSATFGYAGYFNGGVKVTATLTANSVSATTVYQTSDDRLKDYLGDFHFNLADLDRIPLRFFNFKADKERRVLLGTSAQAVQKVLPEIVGSEPADDGEEYLSVDYSKLALVALDCVRQLRDEVATMKAEMAAMRAEIEELKRGR